MVPYYVIAGCCCLLALLDQFCQAAEEKLHVIHQWKFVDFTFANAQARDTALKTGVYIPENCLVLDVDVWQKTDPRGRIIVNSGHNSYNSNNNNLNSIKNIDRKVFVTLPRFKPGVPATLATVSNLKRGNTSLLAPFPNWDAHRENNCDGITSVYRMKIDSCGRLWVLDSGRVDNFTPNPRKVCQPQVLAYDLNNGDKLINRYPIPSHILEDDSLLVTIQVDVRESCQDTFLYIADVTTYKLIVFDIRSGRSWRVGSDFFFPYPLHGRFHIAGTNFNLMDGLLGLALGPVINGDRLLYFHSLASDREGSVYTSVLQNETRFHQDVDSSWDLFAVSEPARPSQSASEAMTDDGIMFFGLLSKTSLACWNSKTPYTRENIHTVYQNHETMQFPSGVKIIGNQLWILTSQLQNFIAGTIAPANKVKYRILVGSVDQLIHSSGCDFRFGEFQNNFEPSIPKIGSVKKRRAYGIIPYASPLTGQIAPLDKTVSC